MGGLKPDFKTIAEFRRTNKQALSGVLRQCARLCMKLDLIAGNVLFLDGTKIRANAGRDVTRTKAWYEQQLAAVDQRIAELLEQCEEQDSAEEGLGSFVTIDAELDKAEKLKQKIENVLQEIKATEEDKLNATDPECAIMHSIQGSHASYNAQMVVDDKHSLIVHTDAVSDSNDRNQFAHQINQANQVLESPCTTACADAGYANTDELEKIDDQGISVIVPFSVRHNAAMKVHSVKAALPMTMSRIAIIARKETGLPIAAYTERTANAPINKGAGLSGTA